MNEALYARVCQGFAKRTAELAEQHRDHELAAMARKSWEFEAQVVVRRAVYGISFLGFMMIGSGVLDWMGAGTVVAFNILVLFNIVAILTTADPYQAFGRRNIRTAMRGVFTLNAFSFAALGSWTRFLAKAAEPHRDDLLLLTVAALVLIAINFSAALYPVDACPAYTLREIRAARRLIKRASREAL